MKYFMIAICGLKKKKGDAAAMFFLIVFATVMMYTGLSVFSNLGNVLDEVNERNNGADVIIGSPCASADGIEKTILSFDEVEKLELRDALYVSVGKYRKGGNEQQEMAFFAESMGTPSELFTPEIIDKGQQMAENAIILPYYLHVAEGYETGDIIELEINHITYECEIYGFMEDVLFATPTNISTFHILTAAELYEDLKEQMTAYTMYRIRLDEGADMNKAEGDIYSAIEKEVEGFQQYYNLSMNYETMSFGDTITAGILMAILILFAVIILLVAIVIICFSIQNSLERNMTNTGIMEASGFTVNQLIFCVVLESMAVVVPAVFCALLLSPVLSEVLGGIVASSIGVRWSRLFDIDSALITVVTILGFVLFATYVKAGKYKKISILDALRGNVKTHNFRKNHVALDKTVLPVSAALGVKGIFCQKRKSIAICLISIALAVACSSGFFLYQNFVLSPDSLIDIVGIERASAQIDIPENQDIHAIGAEIEGIHGVEQVNYYTTNAMKLGKDGVEELCSIDYWEDTGKIKTSTIVEGRYPVYDNEMALSRPVCESLNVKVGDMITVSSGMNSCEYLVTGMTQHITNLGKKAVMTFEGIGRINEAVKPSMIMVYKEKKADYAEIERELINRYPEFKVTDVEKLIQVSSQSISTAMSILCIVFNVCTVLIIVIIMLLMIRMKLVQEKVRIGVDKALGFTTAQVIARIVMNYVPVVFIGSVLGVIISYFTFEGLVSLCVSFCGIRSCNMDRDAIYMIVTVMLITVTSLLASFFISVRVRKIEPSRMIRE
ncbi:MAG: ABC transporter permease [Lachnospiraceae bacterium]|nr:ABC transporter permease [Lachnospiraceae bacterium]